MPHVARVRAVIHGRVQGVGFRFHTLREALQAGLSGWVRNLPDGSVEALFEGDEAQIRLMLDWCRSGPRFANVTHLSERWEHGESEYTGFSIR